MVSADYIFIILLLFLILLVFFISYKVPTKLWSEAQLSGVNLGLIELYRLKSSGVPPELVVREMINACNAGVSITSDEFVKHHLAGGNIRSVSLALIASERVGIDLNFEQATTLDLAGIDPLYAVQISVNPEVKNLSLITETTEDGVLCTIRPRLTTKASIEKLLKYGKNREEILIKRVEKELSLYIRSNSSEILKNTDQIIKVILEKKLETGTAFKIESLELLFHEIKKNVV